MSAGTHGVQLPFSRPAELPPADAALLNSHSCRIPPAIAWMHGCHTPSMPCIPRACMAFISCNESALHCAPGSLLAAWLAPHGESAEPSGRVPAVDGEEGARTRNGRWFYVGPEAGAEGEVKAAV
jgi:hypothetical protein